MSEPAVTSRAVPDALVRPRTPDWLLDILAGCGLGVFVGFVIGLSGSPVVSAAVAAAGGIVGSVIGLRTKEGPVGLRPIRVAALGFSATGSICIGLWLRTHDALAPTIADEAQAWRDAGFSDTDALALTAARRASGSYRVLLPSAKSRFDELVEAGYSPKEAKAILRTLIMPSTPGAASTAVNVTATPQNSVLFSTQPGDYFCGSLEQIDPRADEELLMWEKRGGEWKKTAESLKRHTSDDGRPELVKQVRALVCGQEEAEE